LDGWRNREGEREREREREREGKREREVAANLVFLVLAGSLFASLGVNRIKSMLCMFVTC
jgi:hypothetical protein